LDSFKENSSLQKKLEKKVNEHRLIGKFYKDRKSNFPNTDNKNKKYDIKFRS